MKASVAIQIEPNMPTSAEAIPIVDKVIDYIRSTGLNYYVGPCETAIEGDSLEQLVEIVKNCIFVAEEAGAHKVSAYVKYYYSPDRGVLTIDEKVTKHHQ